MQRPFCRPCNYTAKTPKSFTGLCSGVSVNLTHSSAHNTAYTQAAYAPHTTRRRAYRQTQRLHRYQIPPPRRTLYRTGQQPIIIMYIGVRRCALLWIHARRRNTPQTMPARRGSPAIRARRAARNHWRLPPLIFSGFRPITNKGEQ